MSASMIHNGRLLGGLDFQDANSFCSGVLDSNQIIGDGNFVFVIFEVRATNQSGIISRARIDDAINQGYSIFKQASSIVCRIQNTDGGLRGQQISFSPNIIVGEKILFGVNINSITSYDHVLARYKLNSINTVMNAGVSGNTSIPEADFNNFYVGRHAVDSNPLYTSDVIHAFGLLDATLTEQELIDFANSEGMRVPAGKTIKYYYDFREKSGNTLHGRGSGAVDLTLNNFLSTTEGNANNRWVHPYNLTPK